MNDYPKRKPMRLKNYSYSNEGYYFITICTHNKQKILSNIVGQGLAPAGIQLTAIGNIVEKEICDLESRYKNIKVEKYIIMPNHIHAIIIIQKNTAGASPCPTLSDVVCAFKSLVTRKCHISKPEQKIWQNSFHDHIIRDENDYLKIWNYIDTNPIKWKMDKYFVD